MPLPDEVIKGTATETPSKSEQPGSKEEIPGKDEGVEKKDEVFLRVKVKRVDQKTGKKYDEMLELTQEEAENRIRKDVRFEEEMGRLNAERSNFDTRLVRLAKELAEPIANQRAMEILAQTQKEVPAVKAPTAEELEKDPQALDRYNAKIAEVIEQRAEAKVNKILQDKADEDALLNSYSDAVTDACEDVERGNDKVFRQLLIKVVKADGVAVEDVLATARKLADQLQPSQDLSKLPAEQRKAIVEQYVEENKPPIDKDLPGGKTKVEKKEVPKTWAELEKREAEEHGWTV